MNENSARAAVTGAIVVAVAAAVTAAVYLVADHHTPDYATSLFGQTGQDGVRLKAQLATGLLALALVQLGLALWMYRRLPGLSRSDRTPRAVSRTHRLVGIAAFALSIPITVHCILTYGIEMSTSRTAAHSIAACFFYGAFAAKVLVVRSRSLHRWALPVMGGLLVSTVAVLWYTAAWWFFTNQ
jgi:hypothetical protein